jgi:hypothetical protein
MVACSKNRTHNEWLGMEFAFTHTDPADIQMLMDKKERRLASYRTKTQAVWLLIYFLANRLSGAAEITDEIRSASYGSSFERVFLFDYFRGDVAELTLIK